MGRGTVASNILILRLRLESLKNSLSQVNALADAIKEGNEAIAELHRLIVVEAPSVNQGIATLENLADLLESGNLNAKSLSELRIDAKSLRGTKEGLMRVRTKLNDAAREAGQLHDTLSETVDLVTRAQRVNTSPRSPYSTAKQRVDQLIRSLAGNGDAKGIWSEYSQLVATDMPPIFRDYVEIASGLGLRGNRLDERVCSMAEDLAREWSTIQDLSDGITIPALQEHEHVKRIVRFGFAAWTVWSLPLFAGAFWRVYVEDSMSVSTANADGVPSNDDAVSRMRTYVADCLALEMMGPAYACALLLLRLDPADPGNSSTPTAFQHVRARIILHMLKQRAEREGSPLSEIYKVLSDAWDGVTSLAAIKYSNDDDLLVSSAISLALEELGQLDIPVGRLRRFDEGRWDATRDVAISLLADLEGGTEAESAARQSLKTEITYVDLLNAAWRHRLLPETCQAASGSALENSTTNTAGNARLTALRVRDVLWPAMSRTFGYGGASLARASAGQE
jgi:hypothetical protein